MLDATGYAAAWDTLPYPTLTWLVSILASQHFQYNIMLISLGQSGGRISTWVPTLPLGGLNGFVPPGVSQHGTALTLRDI